MKSLPYKKVTKTVDRLIFLGEEKRLKIFEKNYLEVREKEGRLFSDRLVTQLPYLSKEHRLRNEWLHRAATREMFIKYLKTKTGLQKILDLGCGNGWFCQRMAVAQPVANVFGLDVNLNELQQAARLFSNSQTSFLYGDIFQDIFIPDSFDLIVMNSTAQYFPDINLLVIELLELLTEHGEIHIMDSPFYTSASAQNKARKRSSDYFLKMGVKDMHKHYYHHTFNALQEFSPTILYRPGKVKNSLMAVFGKKLALFPWICIRKG